MIHPDNPPPPDAPPPITKSVAERRRTSLAMGGNGIVVTPEIAAAVFLDQRRQVDIAKAYGLKQTQVSLIKTGKKWTEVTAPLKQKLQSNGSEPDVFQAVDKSAGRTPRAQVICDTCGYEEFVTCDYERKQKQGQWVLNHGQVLRKMSAKGWTEIKGVHRCPKCENERKEEAKKNMPPLAQARTTPITNPQPQPVAKSTVVAHPAVAAAAATPARAPTREQKREIVQMLEVAYDTKLGRYKGKDTDKTVAEVLGDGILPGWVAEIREDMFGPDGGNDEMLALLDQIEAAKIEFKAQMDEVKAKMGEAKNMMDEAKGMMETFAASAESLHKDFTGKIDDLHKRLDAVCTAVGPKAGAR